MQHSTATLNRASCFSGKHLAFLDRLLYGSEATEALSAGSILRAGSTAFELRFRAIVLRWVQVTRHVMSFAVMRHSREGDVTDAGDGRPETWGM